MVVAIQAAFVDQTFGHLENPGYENLTLERYIADTLSESGEAYREAIRGGE